MQVNEVQLGIEVTGKGPPLFALHGFTGDATTWTSLIEATKDSFTIIAVDILGHGNSSCPADHQRYSMDHAIDDLLKVQSAMGIRISPWIGYSMGGRIALGLAAAAPERCSALLIESASPGIPNKADRLQRIKDDEQLASWIESVGVQAFVDYWEQIPLFSSHNKLPESVKKALRKQRTGNRALGLSNSLRGIGVGTQRPLHKALNSLPMPVCCIAGGEDKRYGKIAQEMTLATPRGQLVIIPGTGHTPHLEQPEAFNAAVLNFLKQNVTTSTNLPSGN